MTLNDAISPGDRIRQNLKDRGWTQEVLAQILDRPYPTVNEIIQGKKAITPETAKQLAAVFGDSPEHWLGIEMRFRLSQSVLDTSEISRRARLFGLAPVKDMVRRGWIGETDSIQSLENELKRFFGKDSLDSDLGLTASARKSIQGSFTSEQRAWCVRAASLARSIQAAPYSPELLNPLIRKLRRIAANPNEYRKLSRVLAEAGIRFVVVEPLPKAKIDGAAFWLNETSPVIAMSIRYDRVDCFWHTLGHELSHVRHEDAWHADDDIVGSHRPNPAAQSDAEIRADNEAAETWVDQKELENFILRVGPLYSTTRINQFANRIQMHPGIIVGQLQYRGEVSYSAHRKTLVKVRDSITAETITDGWGYSITQ